MNVTADYKSQTRPASNLFTSRSCSSHPLLVDKSLYEVQLDVAGIIVVSVSTKRDNSGA